MVQLISIDVCSVSPTQTVPLAFLQDKNRWYFEENSMDVFYVHPSAVSNWGNREEA